jgi:ferritin-like metal-binding protein YciE
LHWPLPAGTEWPRQAGAGARLAHLPAQAIEHHEIAAYGTMRALARSSGMRAAADLPERTLREKAADEKLTTPTEGEIDPAALRQGA